MAENDLSIIVKTKVEVDEAQARQEISNFESKYSNNKNNKITLPLDIDKNNSASNIAKAIGSLTRSTAKSNPIKAVLDVDVKASVANIRSAISKIEKGIAGNKIKISLDNDSTDYKPKRFRRTNVGANNVVERASKKYWDGRFKESISGMTSRDPVFDQMKKYYTSQNKEIDGVVKKITSATKVVANAIEKTAQEIKRREATESSYKKKAANNISAIENNKLPRVDELRNILNKGGYQEKKTSGFKSLYSQLENLEKKYRDVVDAMSKEDLSQEQFSKYCAQLRTLDSQLSKTENTIRKFDGSISSQDAMAKAASKISKLKNEFSLLESSWTKAFEFPELKAQIDSFKSKLEDVDEVNIDRVRAEFDQLRAAIKASGADCQSLGSKVSVLFNDIFNLVSIGDIFSHVRTLFKNVVDSVKKINSAMIELKKVTDLSEAGYDRFLDNAGARAKKIGTSMVDYVSGTADFARLGYSVEDAQMLSEAANILFKVGDNIPDISSSTDAIIASMKAYGIEVSNVYSIIDKLNEVSNRTSISTGGLVDAITRSASALASSGLSFEKSLALIVAGNETTRDASMTGNALKTLSMRIRGATTELQESGEEVDEYAQSTSKMRDEILALTGVDIMLDDNTFKDIYVILEEISEVYDNLTDIGRANVTEILFGKLRANVGTSILQNFDQAQKALGIANNSMGSATKEHSKWMDSIEASEAKAAASFEEFSNSMLNSDVVKGFYDIEASFLGFLTNVIDKCGSATPIVAALGAAFLSLKGNIGLFSTIDNENATSWQDILAFGGKSISQRREERAYRGSERQRHDSDFINAFNELIAGGETDRNSARDNALSQLGLSADQVSESVMNMANNAEGAIRQVDNLGRTSQATGKLMKGLAAIGNTLLASLASAAISFVIKQISDAVHHVEIQIEELNDATQAYNEAQSEIESIDQELEKVGDRIDELLRKDKLSFLEENELNNLKDTTTELEEQKKLWGDIAELRLSEANNELEDVVDAFQDGNLAHKPKYVHDPHAETFDEYGYSTDAIYEFQKNAEYEPNSDELDFYTNIDTYKRNIDKRDENRKLYLEKNDPKYLEEAQKYDEIATDALRAAEEMVLPLFKAAESIPRTPSNKESFDVLDTLSTALVEAHSYGNSYDSTAEALSLIWNSDIYSKQVDAIEEMASKGELTVETLKSSTDEYISSFVNTLGELNIPLDKAVQYINDEFGPKSKAYTFNFEPNRYSSTDSYKKLTEAIEEQNAAGVLSYETYTALIAANSEFADLLTLTADGYMLNTEAAMDYIESQDRLTKGEAILAIMDLQEAMEGASDSEKKMLQDQINELTAYVLAIDEATGALSRFRAAQKTPNKDEHFNVGQEVYGVLKDGNETGKIGTDDYEAAMDFILGDDWETEYKEDLPGARKEAERKAERYFGQEDERTGMANFRDDVVNAGFGSWDGETFELFEQVNGEDVTLEGIAESLGMSRDAVQSMFELMETYGGKFDWSMLIGPADQEFVDSLDKEQTEKALEDYYAKRDEIETKMEEPGLTLGEYIKLDEELGKVNTTIGVLEQHLNGLNTGDGAKPIVEQIADMQTAFDQMEKDGITIPLKLTGDFEILKKLMETPSDGSGNTGGSDNGGETTSGDGGVETPVDNTKTSQKKYDLSDPGDPSLTQLTQKYPLPKHQLTLEPRSQLPDLEDVMKPYLPGPEEIEKLYQSQPDSKHQLTLKPREHTLTLKPRENEGKKPYLPDPEYFMGTPEFGDKYLDEHPDVKADLDRVPTASAFKNMEEVEVPVTVDETEFQNNLEGTIEEQDPLDIPMDTEIPVEDIVPDDTVSIPVEPEPVSGNPLITVDEPATPLDIDTSGAESSLSSITNKIKEAASKEVSLNTQPAYSAISTLETRLKRPVTKTVTIKEVGGTNASGTSNASGGRSLVDERGAELIEHVSDGTYELGTNLGPRFTNLKPGDVVHTAAETKKILSRVGKIGNFFRDGLNKGKAIIGKAFATGISGSMSWAHISSALSGSKSSGSKSSSSSKKASSNWKKYVEKLFDWIEIRLERLQTQTDRWILAASEAIGFIAKNAELDKALSSTTQQIKETTEAYQRYMQEADTIAAKTKMTAETIKKIQEGTIDIGSYDDAARERISAYQEWYEKAQACVGALTELREQERELAAQKLDTILSHYQWRIDRLDAIVDSNKAVLDLKEATGIRVFEEDYANAIDATVKKITELQDSKTELDKEFNNMVALGYILEGSELWYQYTSELETLDKTIIETKTDLQELVDASNEITLTNLKHALSDLENSASVIEQFMDLHTNQGADLEASEYDDLIQNGMAQIKNLQAQNEELLKQQQALEPLSEKYQEIQDKINSNNNSILDLKISQEQWNDAVVDLEISKLEKYQDELAKSNDAYQRQFELQQAIEDLERAKSQRTQRVFRDGLGFVYEQDQDMLLEAQKNLEDVVHNQLLDKIDDLIDALDESKADTNVYDANGVLLGEEYTLPVIAGYAELLDNYRSSSDMVTKAMEDARKAAYEQILNGAMPSSVMRSVQIGDIIVQGVDSAEDLANAIMDNFPNAILQAIYGK